MKRRWTKLAHYVVTPLDKQHERAREPRELQRKAGINELMVRWAVATKV